MTSPVEKLDDPARAAAVERLLAKVHEMLAQSTHPRAASFDASGWLADWLATPQPALGGRRPQELLGTESGLAAVMKVLGAIQSGAYL